MMLFLGVVGASSCDARLESVRLNVIPLKEGPDIVGLLTEMAF